MKRAAQTREIPPPLELECLKALWKLGSGNVRDVQQALAPSRELAYTTVMTVMDRLARKGVVVRRKSGRAFSYSPAVSRETLRAAAVRQIVESFFGGSEDELAEYLRGRGGAATAAAGERHAAAAEPAAELDTALL